LFTVVITSDWADALPFDTKFITAAQTPTTTSSILYVDWMHSRIAQAGRTIPEQWEVVVRDNTGKDYNGGAYNYFNQWRDVVYSFTEAWNTRTPSRYKRNVEVTLNSPDYLKARSYSLHGVWPFKIGNISLNYESDGVITFPVSLSIDWFEVTKTDTSRAIPTPTALTGAGKK